MYGDYLQVEAADSPLTFIPPSMYGPPELVHVDWKDTDDPGLVIKNMGQGKIAWLPWDIGESLLQSTVPRLIPGCSAI